MNAANIIAVVSAVIAAVGVAVAVIQYTEGKRRVRSERERLAAQEERLRTAVTAATLGMESADLIVQRAKEDDATLPELQNIARVLRGALAVLAEQLNDEGRELAAARRGTERFKSARAEDLEHDRPSGA